MAEFNEVCKQWRRMCDKHTCSRNKEAFTGLPICPIAATHEGYPCDEDPIDWTEKATKQLEEIVMAWAAEHPEPVYPTWYEFLTSRYHKAWEAIGCDSIPADMAQKLEVPPKPIDYCKEAYRSEDGIMHIRKTPIYPIEPKEDA